MTEPMTMLTDYVLCLLALAFGYVTLRKNKVDGSISRSLWACAFLSLSLGALAGGTWHGFQWQEGFRDSLWKTTTLSMGFTSLFMTGSVVFANCSGKSRRNWLIVAGIKFLLYAGLSTISDDFRIVIADYGSAMLVILTIALAQTLRKSRPEAPWFATGITVSLIASGIQASGISLHEHLNHNDLFHLVQMPALYLFLRGGILLQDRESLRVP